MDIEKKYKILNALYDLHEKFVKSNDFLCKKLCSSCCTCNLTITTLEVHKIITCSSNAIGIILKNINKYRNKNRFIPKITINKMAKLCANKDTLPEEDINYEAGRCPALFEKKCLIYEARPLGCRCMVSTKNCSELGYANIDSYILTINTVFTQYIEHVDNSGYTSNFSDLLSLLVSNDNYYRYKSGFSLYSINNLVKNQTIHKLMIPPEHLESIQPLLSAIRDIKV